MSADIDKTIAKLDEQYFNWFEEHSRLDAELLECMRWMTAVQTTEQMLLSPVLQTLDSLSVALEQHFARELNLVGLLTTARGGTSEVEGLRRQSEHDHEVLQERIATIRREAQTAVLQYDRLQAWKSLTDHMNLLADLLEQHEEHEQESINWLKQSLPKSSSSAANRFN